MILHAKSLTAGQHFMILITHSRFRGSVNRGAPSLENWFQVEKFSISGPKGFFNCYASHGLPILSSQCVLSGPQGVQDPFLGHFLTSCNTCNTQSQRAAHMEFPKIWLIDIYATEPSWPPHRALFSLNYCPRKAGRGSINNWIFPILPYFIILLGNLFRLPKKLKKR